jgi:hypothetical protein
MSGAADSQLACRHGRLVPSRMDAEAEKRRGWHDLGILVVDLADDRLSWPERQALENLGNRLFGARKQPKRGKHGRT